MAGYANDRRYLVRINGEDAGYYRPVVRDGGWHMVPEQEEDSMREAGQDEGWMRDALDMVPEEWEQAFRQRLSQEGNSLAPLVAEMHRIMGARGEMRPTDTDTHSGHTQLDTHTDTSRG